MNLWCPWTMFIPMFSSISLWAAKPILVLWVPSSNHWHKSFQLIVKITQALSAVSTGQMFSVLWFGTQNVITVTFRCGIKWCYVLNTLDWNKSLGSELARCITFINNNTFNSFLYQKVNDIVEYFQNYIASSELHILRKTRLSWDPPFYGYNLWEVG